MAPTRKRSKGKRKTKKRVVVGGAYQGSKRSRPRPGDNQLSDTRLNQMRSMPVNVDNLTRVFTSARVTDPFQVNQNARNAELAAQSAALQDSTQHIVRAMNSIGNARSAAANAQRAEEDPNVNKGTRKKLRTIAEEKAFNALGTSASAALKAGMVRREPVGPTNFQSRIGSSGLKFHKGALNPKNSSSKNHLEMLRMKYSLKGASEVSKVLDDIKRLNKVTIKQQKERLKKTVRLFKNMDEQDADTQRSHIDEYRRDMESFIHFITEQRFELKTLAELPRAQQRERFARSYALSYNAGAAAIDAEKIAELDKYEEKLNFLFNSYTALESELRRANYDTQLVKSIIRSDLMKYSEDVPELMQSFTA